MPNSGGHEQKRESCSTRRPRPSWIDTRDVGSPDYSVHALATLNATYDALTDLARRELGLEWNDDDERASPSGPSQDPENPSSAR
jgi:hypothetical protein